MAIPMTDSSAPSSWELAQRLYDKNVELENGLRRSAKSKVPSGPSVWLQMRENYEAIVLEDHNFSEKHDVEFLLWQLHYRRIEEFRHHINAAASAGANASGGKVTAQPDKIKKIGYVFRSFLTEATGFYHDLLLKIRAKFGLPLSYFNEDIENDFVLDEKNSAEMKKGLMSCHRCLIYLGDLARYKGLYGEGESISCDYAAASSYYLQAGSLCPSSGNPHHQLAILASYAADDLVAVYRYFRSLAVENPFSTARENLIMAFEKNRQSFTQLPSNIKLATGKRMQTRTTGRGRGRGNTKILPKDTRVETTSKDHELTMAEIFKAFSTCFVRLHGIIFTRTSVETFGEVFSSVVNDLNVLLSSGPEEELNFGSTAAENALVILKLIAILIFTVHNVKKQSENQSYAEILQRTLLLQNAFTAAFEFVGYILKRCMELHDAPSSYLLPGILVFVEWLACHGDIAEGFDVGERQAGARSFFWNQCVPFMNKLSDTGLASVDGDKDEACFFNMIRYDGEGTGSRLALWEDFELRGFLPLVPAHTMLDFSRKHMHVNDGSKKDKIFRVQRILAAGQALMNVVSVDQKRMYFDPCLKKFVLGTKPPAFESHLDLLPSSLLDSGAAKLANQIDNAADLWGVLKTSSLEGSQTKVQPYMGGEEEDEEIVFRPTTLDKCPDESVSKLTAFDLANPIQVSFISDQAMQSQNLSSPFEGIQVPTVSNISSSLQPSATNISQHSSQYINSDPSRWFVNLEAFVSDGVKNMNLTENEDLNKQVLQERSNSLQPTFLPPVFSTPVSLTANSTLNNQINAPEVVLPYALDAMLPFGVNSDGVSMKLSATLPLMKKNPVSRPVRHTGPPPGFSHIAFKQQDGVISNSFAKEQLHDIDDYNWLDGPLSSSTKGIVMKNSFDQIAQRFPYGNMNNAGSVTSDSSVPFPGKQVSNVQTKVVNEPKWHDFQLFEQMNAYNRQKLQNSNSEQTFLPEQHQAQSLWSRQYFV